MRSCYTAVFIKVDRKRRSDPFTFAETGNDAHDSAPPLMDAFVRGIPAYLSCLWLVLHFQRVSCQCDHRSGKKPMLRLL